MAFSLSGAHIPLPPAEGNLTPYHPNCNCSASVYVIAYKNDKEIDKEIKKAKMFDPNKDTRSISQQKAYAEQQRLNRINNYEKKSYAKKKSELEYYEPE